MWVPMFIHSFGSSNSHNQAATAAHAVLERPPHRKTKRDSGKPWAEKGSLGFAHQWLDHFWSQFSTTKLQQLLVLGCYWWVIVKVLAILVPQISSFNLLHWKERKYGGGGCCAIWGNCKKQTSPFRDCTDGLLVVRISTWTWHQITFKSEIIIHFSYF